MDTQPQGDTSPGLEDKVAEIQAELVEIKRLLKNLARDIDDKLSLTDQPSHSYYHNLGIDNQEKKKKENLPIISSNRRQAEKSTHPPYVEEGEKATCARCGHAWIPFVRRPKQCPSCHQTWYKPKAWTRNRKFSTTGYE